MKHKHKHSSGPLYQPPTFFLIGQHVYCSNICNHIIFSRFLHFTTNFLSVGHCETGMNTLSPTLPTTLGCRHVKILLTVVKNSTLTYRSSSRYLSGTSVVKNTHRLMLLSLINFSVHVKFKKLRNKGQANIKLLPLIYQNQASERGADRHFN